MPYIKKRELARLIAAEAEYRDKCNECVELRERIEELEDEERRVYKTLSEINDYILMDFPDKALEKIAEVL